MWVLKKRKQHHGRFYQIIPYVLGFGLGIGIFLTLKL